MGKNRIVLHPRFGADIYLGVIALDRTITAYGQPLASSPCANCNLCEETCPTGAIARNGDGLRANVFKAGDMTPIFIAIFAARVCPGPWR